MITARDGTICMALLFSGCGTDIYFGHSASGVGAEGGGAGGPAGDPVETLESVDLRGDCDGGRPDTPGETLAVDDLRSYDLTAYGSQMGHACGEDQGRFVYLQVEGDFDVSVQLSFMDNFGLLAGEQAHPVKAGLMMREGLEPPARYIAIWAIQPSSEYFPDAFHFDFRSQQGAYLGVTGFNYGFLNQQDEIFQRQLPNIWVRLRREGPRVDAFASEDGETWLAPSLASFENDLGPELYLGIAASSAASGGYAARSVTHFRNLSGFDRVSSPP